MIADADLATFERLVNGYLDSGWKIVSGSISSSTSCAAGPGNSWGPDRLYKSSFICVVEKMN